jgi:hypothetical protein
LSPKSRRGSQHSRRSPCQWLGREERLECPLEKLDGVREIIDTAVQRLIGEQDGARVVIEHRRHFT